ncbi:26422_t:CDS:1, partial [Gigaspora margarita]
KSFETYLKENKNFEELKINSTIFYIDATYEATFQKPISTKVLDKLVNEAETEF